MKLHLSLITRRSVLRSGAALAGGAAASSLLPDSVYSASIADRPVRIITDPKLKEIVMRGLDAARQAGAEYADVRLSYTRTLRYGSMGNVPYATESLHAGVRALVKGYWGVASSPLQTGDELTRLGRSAAHHAKSNDSGLSEFLLLPSAASVKDEHWETPVQIDPFQLHPDVIHDHLNGLSEDLFNLLCSYDTKFGDSHGGSCGAIFETWSQEKAFGSTGGAYCTQRLIRSMGSVSARNPLVLGTDEDLLTPQGIGWELYSNHDLVDRVRWSIERNRQIARMPVKPIDIGKYHTVFDAKSTAELVNQSIGNAAQIDVALGIEANNSGTSYLNEPDEMLGQYSVGARFLSVTADRSDPVGLATVKWDDEGVTPEKITLVEGGVLQDYQTSREGAGWLKPTYDRLGRTCQSHGYSYCETANHNPAIHNGNLTLHSSGSTGLSIEELETEIDNGMSVVGMVPEMDFQLSGGYSRRMMCFEIKGGRRTARIWGAGMMFKTSEIWKGLSAIGRDTSKATFGLSTSKGGQASHQSVTAVPIAVKNMTFIDPERR